jgi:VanZ family protein
VPKYLLFLIALFWTGTVAYLCLVPSDELPVINIPNLDKCIHTFFHFVFTLVWFLYFNKQLKDDSIFKPLLISFLFSILFGILIELLQGLITTTRSADILDGLANLIGASLAVFVTVFCTKYNILNIIFKK